MDKQRIVEMLQSARSDELAAVVQYMKHHYEGQGLESPEIVEQFKKASIDEMKHCEELAERIVYLGGVPTTRTSVIKQGGDLWKMVRDNLDTENDAIAKYRQRIKVAAEEGDSTTRLMLEKILTSEEGHAYAWETILASKK